MPILKFWTKDDTIVLDNFRLEDITNDPRTKNLRKETFMLDKYKIFGEVYMVINDFFFSMAKLLNKGPEIHAMMVKVNDKFIVIIPSKSYVFLNGHSVEPLKYEIDSEDIKKSKLV
jgi:hypothetical protein